MSAGQLDLMRDVGEIPQRAAEAIEAQDDERVALGQHLERKLKPDTAVAFRAAPLFFEHDHTAIAVERRLLDREILVVPADARLSDAAVHAGGSNVT